MSDAPVSRTASSRFPAGELAALRDQLTGERSALLAQIDRLETDARDDSWKERRSDDMVETGSATGERERMLALASNARRTVSQIDAALERMERGTYGRCTSCGQPIAAERLEALPQAMQCLDCRRSAERSRR